jgi:hypothetical protein
MADVSADAQGVWLHNLIWGGINPTGLMENYWYAKDHIYRTVDLRGQFKNYYTFIKDIPLNNGKYVNAAAVTSNAKLRAWGQKDLTNQRAHLWIQNTDHIWTNTGTVAPLSGTVTIPGLNPNTSFGVEWWDPYTGAPVSVQNLSTNANGELQLPVTNLTTDTAVRIFQQAGTPTTPTVQPTITGSVTITPGTPTGGPSATPTATRTPTPAASITTTPLPTNPGTTLTPAPTSTISTTLTPAATRTNTPVGSLTNTPVPTTTAAATLTPTPPPSSTPTWTPSPTMTYTPSPTNTPTFTPSPTATHTATATLPPAGQQLILTPSALTSEVGTTQGSLTTLGELQASGTEDTSTEYVILRSDRTQYTGTMSFTLPTNVPATSISDLTLQVNFKANGTSKQTWTWSIYNWSTNTWVLLGDVKTVRRDSTWLMLEYRTPFRPQYVSSRNEIRVQMRTTDSRGDTKIDYVALKLTTSQSLAAPALLMPAATSTPVPTLAPSLTPIHTTTPEPPILPSATTAPP